MIKSYLEVIKNTHFRSLWLAQVASQIALNMLVFVLAIKVYQATRSSTAVSLMLLTFGIPSIIFGIFAGGVVDYYDKKYVLFLCNISRVFLFFLFFIFSLNIPVLFILALLISIITQFFIPAEAPSIGSLVKAKDLLAANSLFTISFYISTVLGYILAGPTVKILGDKNVYLVMLILMLTASFFIYFIPNIKSKKEKTDLHFHPGLIISRIGEGIRFIFANIRVKQSLILLTFSQALLATLAVLAPGFSDKVLSIDLNDASYLVMGPAAVGLVLGAFLVGSFGNKILKGKIITAGLISAGLSLVFLSLVSKAELNFFSLGNIFSLNNLFLAILLLFTLGIANSFISVPANTILQADSESNVRGRVYGVLTSMTGGVSLLPVIFSGILADLVGVSRTLSLMGIFLLITSLYQYLKRNNQDNIIK